MHDLSPVMMHLAENLAAQSKCCEGNVGCVIVSEDHKHICSMAYNGSAANSKEQCNCVSDLDKYGCVHAEQNALIKDKSVHERKVMYITMSPCSMCASLIVNHTNIVGVYYKNDWKNNPGIEVLREAGIWAFKMNV